MLYHERCARKKGYKIIAGVDEAGRGSLAGPVVAAAVFLKTFKFKNRIDDSKKLSALQRREAFFEIIQKSFFGVGVVNEGAVDVINISRATDFAVDSALTRLFRFFKKPKPSFKNTIILLDGRLKSDFCYPSKEIIGGDGKSLSIAAASIIAKVIRDRLMCVYGRIYPQYGFDVHKGYGTKKHMQNIERFGLSPIHRKTFCKKFLGKNGY